jgi:molecular chaperone GrpE
MTDTQPESQSNPANEPVTPAQEAGQTPPTEAPTEATRTPEEEIAGLKAALQELNDQVLRATAAAENARRRADEDIAKSRKFAIESFAESLLPVLDSMDAALAIEQVTLEQMKEGVQATQAQLVSALERNKVLAVAPAAGEKFDPNIHQAISVVPSELEANAVVATLQKGYVIAERVLRPALVTVSSGSAA